MILVACIGNIFLGDDAFGVEVARRLLSRPIPEGVRVTDFGIRGIDLTYALMDPWDLTILVDACPRGGRPGDVYVIEPDFSALEGGPVEAHSLDPMNVLRMLKSMGGTPGRIVLVGCEPCDLGGEDGKLGLTEPVEAAVAEAAVLIETLLSRTLEGAPLNGVLQTQ